MEGLKEKRAEFKRLREGAEEGSDVYHQYDTAQLAIKIYQNSSYGSFGFKKFKFADKRIAELITAIGRKFAVGAKELAESDKYGFRRVYGDTDSLLLQNRPDDVNFPQETFDDRFAALLKECYQRFNLPIDNDSNFIEITPIEKKQYFGIDAKTKKVIVKWLEGKKKGQCQFVNDEFGKFMLNYERGLDPIPDVKEGLAKVDSGQLSPEDLIIQV